MSHAVRTDGLTKRFGDEVAVENVSLSVEAGEVYGFLGPNGAGKSTTISMLIDHLRPTAGEARVFGLDPTSDEAKLHERVGVLPDGFEPYKRRSAREHLELAVDTHGSDDDPDALLERVGLGDAASRPAGGFSRGMTQRLGLAMALVGDPDLLVLDEPFQGLDPRGVTTIREVVHESNADGTTVFFSSHVLGQVELVEDCLGILDNGRLVAEGSLEELRERANLGRELHLETDGPTAPAHRALTDRDEVRHVRPESDTIVAQLDSSGDPERLLKMLESAGVSIRRRSSRAPSVESVFLAYTESPAGQGLDRNHEEVAR